MGCFQRFLGSAPGHRIGRNGRCPGHRSRGLAKCINRACCASFGSTWTHQTTGSGRKLCIRNTSKWYKLIQTAHQNYWFIKCISLSLWCARLLDELFCKKPVLWRVPSICNFVEFVRRISLEVADIRLQIKGRNQRLWFSHLACPFWNGLWEQRSAWTTPNSIHQHPLGRISTVWGVQLDLDDF